MKKKNRVKRNGLGKAYKPRVFTVTKRITVETNLSEKLKKYLTSST